MRRKNHRFSRRPLRHRLRRMQREHRVEGLENRLLLFNATGSGWGEGAALEYGYMPEGVEDSAGLDGGWTNTAIADHEGLPANATSLLSDALQQWSQVANIEFTQTADSDAAFGDNSPADIRIGSHPIDGAGGIIYHAFSPTAGGDSRSSDIHFDVDDTFSTGLFLRTSSQAVGIAIGLGIQDEEPGVMNSTFDLSAPYGAQLDDVRGAQLFYGPAVVTDLVVTADSDPAPGDQANDGQQDTYNVARRTETIVSSDGAIRDVDVIDITINGNVAYSVDATMLETLTFVGSDDSDNLVLSFSNGSPLPRSGQIRFDAGDNLVSDALQLVGSASAEHIAYQATGSRSGIIDIDDGQRVIYSGVDPIFDNLVAPRRSYNDSFGGSQAFHLLDDNQSDNGLSVATGANLGFTTWTFAVPTEDFAIDLEGGRDIFFYEPVDSAMPTVRVDGGAESDHFLIRPSTTTALDIEGGANATGNGDRLSLDLVGIVDVTVPDRAASFGSITAPGWATVDFRGIEQVITPDRFEPNDNGVTHLGSETSITLTDLTIHDDDDLHDHADTDVFRFTAHETGVATIAALFDHSAGDLRLAIYDTAGNEIVATDSVTDNERVVVPVIGQRTYEVRVAPAIAGTHTNVYSLEIETFSIGSPFVLGLDPASDTGVSSTDRVTADTTPTIVVQADVAQLQRAGNVPLLDSDDIAAGGATGAILQLTLIDLITGAEITGFGQPIARPDLPDSDLLFQFTSPELQDGTYAVTAAWQIYDHGVSATGPYASGILMTVDTVGSTEPLTVDLAALSDSGRFDTDNITSVETPVFVGTTAAGTLVELRTSSGEVLGTTTADADGAWQITSIPLDDGIYQVFAVGRDIAGNLTEAGQSLDVEIDTSAPNTPYLDLLRDSDLGFRDDDNITNDTTLTFSMTTEDASPDGHLSEFNYIYRLYLRAEDAALGVTGAERLIYDSSVDLSIPFEDRDNGLTRQELLQRTLDVLPDGVHNFKLEVQDRAGNRSDDYWLNVTIDTAIPTVAFNMLAASDSGASNSDRVTNITTPVFTGTSVIGSRVRLFANGELVGESTVGSDETDGRIRDGLGQWQAESANLTDGSYDIAIEIETEAGTVSRSDDGVMRVVIDSVAPNTPLLDLMSINDSGISSTDNITSVANPLITITTSDAGGAANPFNLRYLVYDRPEATVAQGAETLIYDSAADDQIPDSIKQDGLITLQLVQARLPELTEGAHNLKVEVIDRAGNISHDAQLNLVIDTSALDGTIDLAAASDSGVRNDDNVTRVDSPIVHGVGPAGAQVRVFADDVLVAESVVGSDASDGDADNRLGLWEAQISNLDSRLHVVVATFESVAGAVSTSDSLIIEVDSDAPNTPLLDLLSVHDTGQSNTDNITAEDSPLVTMTTTDPANPNHLNAFNFRFRLYDRFENTAEALIYDSATDSTLAAEDGLTDLRFVQTALANLAVGEHNLRLEVVDRAGNSSDDFLLPLIVDGGTTPVSLDLLASSDSGRLDDDNVTRIATPAFSGTGEVGAHVRLFANGELVGESTVGSDTTAGEPNDGIGLWEITSEPLDDGTYVLLAQTEDVAGNINTSESLTVVVDTIEPNTPFLDLTTASDTGADRYDNITADATPTVTMTTHDADNGLLHNLIYRIYVRSEELGGGESQERLIYDSSNDNLFPIVNIENGFTDLRVLQRTLPELPAGMHNLKLEVEDRAGNISHDYLLDILILDPNIGVGDVTIDLLAASDTGMNDNDNVTRINEPTFTGIAGAGTTVQLINDNQVFAEVIVGDDDSDAIPNNGLGVWTATSIPIDDGVYSIVARSVNLAGSESLSDPIVIKIDTLAPNTPALDLTALSDSGRHDADNITSDTTLTFTMTTEDPPIVNPFPEWDFNLKYRIFVRPEAASVGESGTERIIYDSTVDATIPVGNLLDMLTDLEFLERTIDALPHGIHNFKLEVEDRAGNISHDLLLNVEIDTEAPSGSIDLDPNSDSGVVGFAGTFSDRITSDTTPWFQGSAEADAVVRIEINGVPAGSAVATPIDGNDAFPPPDGIQGNFHLESDITLADGLHTVTLYVEDRAGNGRDEPADTLTLFVETQGPQVTSVVVGNASVDGTFSFDGQTSLFAPKPASGPNELISSIVVQFQDGPIRVNPFVYDALITGLAQDVGNYSLIGDANGQIPILAAQPTFTTIDGAVAMASVELVFHDPVDAILFNGNDRGAPLPDDRFTLTISDQLADPAGNRLDGESNAAAPFVGANGNSPTPPNLPSGDGEPGGAFTARFTVDSRPELGVWAASSVWVDINGNFVFDPQNPDASNRDIVFSMAFASDDIIAGNFTAPGTVTDGYDRLAAYGRFGGSFRWIVDLDNDGNADLNVADPANVNGLPVAGDFDGNRANGDEVAVFTGSTWHFDTDHSFNTSGATLATSMRGYPIVGDFDRDGFDDLATWTDDRFQIDLANNALRGWDGVPDATFRFGFIGVRERPVAADMDQDGYDDLGLWVPDRAGVTVSESSEWYFLVSGGSSVLDRIAPALNPIAGLPEVKFDPIPFGNDIYAQFGDEFAIPLVGNFDPPTDDVPVEEPVAIHTNPDNPLDVNADGFVTGIDALLVINDINETGGRELSDTDQLDYYLDANGDGFVSGIDALQILNVLNTSTPAPSAPAVPSTTAARDLAFSGYGQTNDAETELDDEGDEASAEPHTIDALFCRWAP